MAFDLAQRPQHLAGKAPALAAAAIQGIGGAQPPHISIAKQRFTLVDAAGNEMRLNELYMDVIVLDVNPAPSKVYYAEAYDPSEVDVKPPTCWSDNGVAPSQEASEPQNATCAGCPMNVWGSEISQVGSKVKACRDYKKIAVYAAADPKIQYQLRIPPASLKLWKLYAQNLGAQGADLCDVITRITFDDETQGVLNFEPMGWVPPTFVPWYEKYMAEGKSKQLTGAGDKPIAALATRAAPRQVTQQAQQPKAPPAQQEALQAAQPQAEAPRRGRPPKAPPATAAATVASAMPQAEVSRAPMTQQEVDEGPEIPDFLRRTAGNMVPNNAAPAPTADISSQLDEAFKL